MNYYTKKNQITHCPPNAKGHIYLNNSDKLHESSASTIL